MKLRLQERVCEGEIDWGNWQVAIHGEPIDDRGRSVLREVMGRAVSTRGQYSPDTLEVAIDSKSIPVDELAGTLGLKPSDRVLLEATTLGLAEIVLCCKVLRALGHDGFDIVYVEPDEYHRPQFERLLHRRDFELSSVVPGIWAIPGSAILRGDRKPFRSVFFVGDQDARLRRAFEELQMVKAEKSSITLGVPAFKAGWEMYAMANNIPVIREHNIRGGIHFCGADNPYAVYELLCEVYEGLEGEERLVLAPIGTKPHGIGVALFAAIRDDVGILLRSPATDAGAKQERRPLAHVFN